RVVDVVSFESLAVVDVDRLRVDDVVSFESLAVDEVEPLEVESFPVVDDDFSVVELEFFWLPASVVAVFPRAVDDVEPLFPEVVEVVEAAGASCFPSCGAAPATAYTSAPARATASIAGTR